MGYGTAQISIGTKIAKPILETTGTHSSTTYNNFDHTNWAWNPAGTIESSALSYTDPSDAGTFQHRPYHPDSAITGITASTPIFTFNQGQTRKLAFRTKISGSFTLKFKIIAGGNVPTPTTENSKINTSEAAGSGFEASSGAWAGVSVDHPIKVAYNTTSFLSGSGTWVEIQSLHAYYNAGGADFDTQKFTEITINGNLTTDAYVGLIQPTNSSVGQRWAIADVELTYNITSGTPATYNSIAVSNFTDHWNEMQRVLNGGIATSDISTTPWVETYHMKPMRFFGSPAPRVEAISGDVHHRFERTTSMLYKGQGEDFMPIHGLATTIHVAPPFLDQTITALVRCNFYAEESDNEGTFQPEYKDLCDFGLFVIQGNGVPQFISGSMRNLYQEKDGTYIGKKNISIINRVTLSVGINHVYIGIRFAKNDSGRGRAHISRKVFIVDVKYI
tara:strand:+ start:1938 stop:3275 length:1338 start_codon:yes stop_codon:yes gene_type:complete